MPLNYLTTTWKIDIIENNTNPRSKMITLEIKREKTDNVVKSYCFCTLPIFVQQQYHATKKSGVKSGIQSIV